MKQSSTYQARKDILSRIRKIQPFLEGSLTLTQKRCGNPKCRCAQEGPIHETCLLTWKEDQKTRTLYVPKHLRTEVAQWIEEWKTLKHLIHLMSKTQRKLLVSVRKSTKR